MVKELSKLPTEPLGKKSVTHLSRDHGLAVTFAVCSSRLNRRKGFQQGFFATKNCTASRLKV